MHPLATTIDIPSVSARRPAVARTRSLAPKEHGAYGQLGLPLCAALAMGTPRVAALAIAAGAVLAFAAHEPLLVLAGTRGARARREDGARALRRFATLGIAAVTAGGAGIVFAPTAARVAALVPLGLAALLAPFVFAEKEKTLPDEIVAGAALAAASLPVAIASGVSIAAAWSAWIAWAIAFAASTIAVRAVVAHARAHVAWFRRAAGPLALAVATFALARGGVVTPLAAAGAAPMLVAAIALAVAPPPPTALRRVGWALVAASAILCVVLAVSAHV
jgi:hypothetical protein